MRYLGGFVLFLLALGTLRLVGCGDEGPECNWHPDCDDGSPCTDGYCRQGVCVYELVERESTHPNTYGIVRCTLDDGGPGYCVDGVCRENFCDNGCGLAPYFDSTVDYPDVGSRPGCERGFFVPNGTPCEVNGVAGVCISAECSEENPCEGVVCEGPPCTEDNESRLEHYCDYEDGGECRTRIAEHCPGGGGCVVGGCDPQSGECSDEPVPDGYLPDGPGGGACCNGIQCDSGCTPGDTCDPETRECVYAPLPNGPHEFVGFCCGGVSCSGGGPCKSPTGCLPGGGCVYTSDSEGEECCIRREERCWICIPPATDCCSLVCVESGACDDGVCR